MYKGIFTKNLSESKCNDFGGGSDNNDYLFLTARNLKIMISDLPVGTHLRVRTSNNNNHSIVLAGKTDTTITVYDANGCGSNSSLLDAGSSNYSGHCQINKQVFTYKNFAKDILDSIICIKELNMNDRLRLILLVMALSVTVALTGCSQPEQNSSIAADDNTTSLQSSIDTVTDTSKPGV